MKPDEARERAPAHREWDVLPGESPEQHEAFLTYMKQGPRRSVRYTARLLKRSQRVLEKWSLKHDWTRRAREFDAWRNQQRLKGIIGSVHTSVAKEIQLLMDTIEVVALNAQRMKRDFKKNKQERLGARSHKDLLAVLLPLARLYRGEPGAITEALTQTAPEEAWDALTRAVDRIVAARKSGAVPVPRDDADDQPTSKTVAH